MLRLLTNAVVVAGVAIILAGCGQKHSDNGDERIRILFAGDLLLDRGVRAQIEKRGVAALFDSVREQFRQADFVVANLECPVTNVHAPVNKRYVFRGDPVWLPALKEAGITHLVMANNHSYDQGREGMKDTYDNLVKNKLIPVGYGANQQDACSPVILEKHGVRVAVFSSVLLALENWAYLPDSPGICQATVADLKDRITAFRKANRDCRIVLMLHWGAEFQTIPMPEQRQQARELIDAGADAIIGCHPHVVQDYTLYKEKPIFFSIGNFVFDQSYDAARRGKVIELFYGEHSAGFAVHDITIDNCTPRFHDNPMLKFRLNPRF